MMILCCGYLIHFNNFVGWSYNTAYKRVNIRRGSQQGSPRWKF